MTTHIDIASANILDRLSGDDARMALAGVIDRAPDLIGLQEWGMSRYRLLRRTGEVLLLPRPARRAVRLSGSTDYAWIAPLQGGCVIGVRRERFELIDCRLTFLSPMARAEKINRPLALRPPRVAMLGIFVDRDIDRTVCLVNFHLTAGVQLSGHYRDDRPMLVARHRLEVHNLERLVAAQLAMGHIVHAVGDSNFDGMRIAGLTSAWEGRSAEPGTLGSHRKVDDVFGPGPAADVMLLDNSSDHKAVIARRPNP